MKNKLFARFYALLFISCLVWLVVTLSLRKGYRELFYEDRYYDLAGVNRLLVAYLNTQARGGWDRALDVFPAETNWRVQIEAIDSLSPALQRSLRDRGHAGIEEGWADIGDFFFLIPDSDKALRYTRSESIARIRKLDTLLQWATFLFFTAVFYLWFLRLARRVDQLKSGALRFKDGYFTELIAMKGSDEIAALAKTMNGMASRIAELIQAQQDLLRMVSHEIRTPLARLRFHLEKISVSIDAETREKIECELRQRNAGIQSPRDAKAHADLDTGDAQQLFEIHPGGA